MLVRTVSGVQIIYTSLLNTFLIVDATMPTTLLKFRYLRISPYLTLFCATDLVLRLYINLA